MKIEEQFKFLQEYGVQYKKQVFKNAFNTNFVVYTDSFYNENGCFTIYNLAQKGEVYYYFSKEIEDNLNKLIENEVDVYNMYPSMLEKIKKMIFYNFNKEIKVLSNVVKKEIVEKRQFFGIKID